MSETEIRKTAYEKVTPKLRSFLEKEGILDQFLDNYVALCKENNLEKLRESEPMIGGIITAFVWNRTPQGYGYWCKLDRKFYCSRE